MKSASPTLTRKKEVVRYYRFHSRIYDATRWSFLFGRKEMLMNLPNLPANPRILEVGCGTGKNIQLMEFLFPDAQIYGVDLSQAMLDKAGKKLDNQQVTLINRPYGTGELKLEPFDLILCSYSLSMFGDDIDHILQKVYEDLKPNGYVAVLDFHTTPFPWFRSWMKKNHVSINGRLLIMLQKFFYTGRSETYKAYLGLWKYFSFLGKRK